MKKLTVFLALAISQGCGGVGAGDDAGTADIDGGDADDTVAPAVVSVSPAANATGVAADAEIVVAFSEPMNQASVEAAWQSTDLAAADVDFAWNAAGDRLTAVPKSPLPLALGAGLDPSAVAALTIAIEVGTGAQDLAGNSLAQAAALSFATQKRMTADLVAITSLTRTMRGDGLVFNEAGIVLTVGDTTGNLQTKTFASFTMPTFPSGAAIESATLAGNQTSTVNTPYVLGEIRGFHFNAAVIDAGAFDNAISMVGDFSTTLDPGVKTMLVTDEFIDDLANRAARGNRTQFRLEFPTATNSNATADEARFSRSSWALSVVYIAD